MVQRDGKHVVRYYPDPCKPGHFLFGISPVTQELFLPDSVFLPEFIHLRSKGEKIGDISNVARILIDDFKTAVIPCADFGAPQNIRLSYAISMEDIEKGLDRIGEFLKELN